MAFIRASLILWLACAAACAATPDPASDGGGGDDDDGPTVDAGPGGADGPPVTPGGCTGNGAALQPFGNHAHAYAPGSILPSHKPQDHLDTVVRATYDAWKSRYVEAGCVPERSFVRSGTGNATISEALGYGMVITAYMAGHDPQARTLFDAMFRHVLAHPSAGNGNLMSWQQANGCGQNPAANSASDGDLDIAYALLLADRQWGSSGAIHYHDEALRILGAMRQSEVDASASFVRLGDWTNPGDAVHFDATRASDFMPAHFASFEAAVGDGAWANVRDRSYQWVATLQQSHAPATGLLPDFVVHPTGTPAPAQPFFLERDVDGAYSFNSCRVPFRLAVHFLTAGDTRARTAAQKMNQWIRATTGDKPDQIRSGYSLAGNVSNGADFRSNAFVGPFGVGAMVDAGNQGWLNAVWDALEQSTASEGYYADSLELLSMIVMSGNWWSPEAAPCQ